MKWFKIPMEQTAYQKNKGCYMHVFFVRTLIAVAVKQKKALFIGITDFAAAFDSISRRLLFQKLVCFGIGSIMLNALKDMYNVTCTFVEMNGEYSHEFDLTAGVLQGAATSTILFIAYTADLITLFNTIFKEEDLIHMFHILVHADDALILATTKLILKEKFQVLESYCEENKIKLQPSKCSFIAINSSDKDSIVLKDGQIDHNCETIYLGSTITDAGKINYDIKKEIKGKEKVFNKFFLFLHKNYYAPLKVKLKVLDACLYSSVLYNCETWGNVNTSDLEKQYCATLKYILGIRHQCCNEFPYIELGLPTLTSIIQTRQYKFYCNIVKNKDWPLLRYIVNLGRRSKCNFIAYYDKLINSTTDIEFFKKKSIKNLQNDIKRKAEAGRSRYVKYTEINPTLSKPNHIYDNYISTTKLQKLSKLRTSCHSLAIEIGRHTRTRKPKEMRLCHCNEFEDEEHFILKCYAYDSIRQRYIGHIPEVRLCDVLQMDFAPEFVYQLHKQRDIYTVN